MTVLGATLQHNMKHAYHLSALKGRATASPTFPVTYNVCICPYTYSLLRRQTHSHRLSESWLSRESSFPNMCSPVAGVKTTPLIHALLNDHYPLHTVHTQVHASMQAQVKHQHLPKGVAGMSMLPPKSPASQLSFILAKQWMAVSILITAHATAPTRPQGFLELDCHIRQS